MFRTSNVHLQEYYIVHAALYGTFSVPLCKHSTRLEDVLDIVHFVCSDYIIVSQAYGTKKHKTLSHMSTYTAIYVYF